TPPATESRTSRRPTRSRVSLHPGRRSRRAAGPSAGPAVVLTVLPLGSVLVCHRMATVRLSDRAGARTSCPQAPRGDYPWEVKSPPRFATPASLCTGWSSPLNKRFLTLADVAETLNITMAQAKALVRSGALPAVKIGGRGVWRVEVSMLEDYIERMYAQTRESIARLSDEMDAVEAESDDDQR